MRCDSPIVHFGITLKPRKYLPYLNREEYAQINTKPSFKVPFLNLIEPGAYTDDTASEYTMDWCTAYRELCLENLDLNLKFFLALDQEDFDRTLQSFLAAHPEFTAVSNLNEYDGVEGYYMMVLDKYKQVYIGKTDNIKRRIQQHWGKRKPLDRILFPMYAVKTSILSIDTFGALDTTRIFVSAEPQVFGREDELVSDFPDIYKTNRIGGDINDGIGATLTMTKKPL